MKEVQLIFPHQLFEDITHLKTNLPVVLVEEMLFFNQYKFHKQKIAFHRASMQCYKDYLADKGFDVRYVQAKDVISDIRKLISWLNEENFNFIHYINPVDDWLSQRIKKACLENQILFREIETKLFLNSEDELNSFFKTTKKKFFQTSFYKEQRKKRNILIGSDGKPVGGKWTFDTENRKKYPKNKIPPQIQYPKTTIYHTEALAYVKANFFDNYGEISDFILYPINFEQAKTWFFQFLEHRFYDFGAYEDAIVKDVSILNHSVLSPLLNTGLLSPSYIVSETLNYAYKNDIPINSTEGFIRQIIGWREFIRGVYKVKGREERTKNFWNHSRKIPQSFYNGTTGIIPLDRTIKKVLKTGYAHHIERLMLLGNIMVLCEFNPDDVYQWFMELFIDAYDWVMVPNVYGMSLFADGGLMSTKPYISGSNYILKMSDYLKSDWQDIWDGLFWRFMDKHKDFFLSNPRLAVLVRSLEKMDEQTKAKHFKNAINFLNQLNVK